MASTSTEAPATTVTPTSTAEFLSYLCNDLDDTTTLDWDVVANYDTIELNKLLKRAYDASKHDTKTGTGKETAGVWRGLNLISTDEYESTLGDPYSVTVDLVLDPPYVSFPKTVKTSVARLTMPIKSGTVKSSESGTMTTYRVAEKSHNLVFDNLQLGTLDPSKVQSWSPGLSSFQFPDPDKEKTSRVVTMSFPLIDGKDTSINTVYKLETYTPPARGTEEYAAMKTMENAAFGTMVNNYITGGANNFDRISYALASINNTPAPSDLVPKSFSFATAAVDGYRDVLSVFVCCSEQNLGRKTGIQPIWQTQWNKLKTCPIPNAPDASAKEVKTSQNTASLILNSKFLYSKWIAPELVKQGYTPSQDWPDAQRPAGIRIKATTNQKLNLEPKFDYKSESQTTYTRGGPTNDTLNKPGLTIHLTDTGGENGSIQAKCSWTYSLDADWSVNINSGDFNTNTGGAVKATFVLDKTISNALEVDSNYHLKSSNIGFTKDEWKSPTFEPVHRDGFEGQFDAHGYMFDTAGRTYFGADLKPSEFSLKSLSLDLNFFLTTNLLMPNMHVIDIDTSKGRGVRLARDAVILGKVKQQPQVATMTMRHLLASGLQEKSISYLAPHAVSIEDVPRSVKFLRLLWNKPIGDAIFSAIAQNSDRHLQIALRNHKIRPAELEISEEDVEELQTGFRRIADTIAISSFAVDGQKNDTEKVLSGAESSGSTSQTYLYGNETTPAAGKPMVIAVWDGVYDITSPSNRADTFLRIDGIQDKLYVGSLQDVLGETAGCARLYELPTDGTLKFQHDSANVVLKFTNSVDDKGTSIRKFGSTSASSESWSGQSYIPPAVPENRHWYDHVGVGSVIALIGLLGGVQLVIIATKFIWRWKHPGELQKAHKALTAEVKKMQTTIWNHMQASVELAQNADNQIDWKDANGKVKDAIKEAIEKKLKADGVDFSSATAKSLDDVLEEKEYRDVAAEAARTALHEYGKEHASVNVNSILLRFSDIDGWNQVSTDLERRPGEMKAKDLGYDHATPTTANVFDGVTKGVLAEWKKKNFKDAMKKAGDDVKNAQIDVQNANTAETLAKKDLSDHQEELRKIKAHNEAPIQDRVTQLTEDVKKETKKIEIEAQNLETAKRVEEKLKTEKEKAEREADDKKKEGKNDWDKKEGHFHKK